ncbi:aminotransferase class V-fold PLP-dependent enzyme [Agromyces silvae]|uniref:aminotransferase class V-fold PLP-dependent enzyme n=1 Tax=Agromyces silvae TaxID=3388266 RepID=UPI00280B139F|nr:aminotransferase class V-fold PLP-dependent enzyme [Agromyces protaetiae]
MTTVGAQPLLPLSAFIGLEDEAYFYTGAHAPGLKAGAAAMEWAYAMKSTGPRGRAHLFEREEAAREQVARLVDGASADDVGLLGDASTAWSSIANGWDWKPGDNVVLNEFEHPSVFAPWIRLRDRGLEVRFVRRRDDWDLPLADLAAACDERTVAIGLSHVGYVTGLRYDPAEVAAFADSRGIPVILDVSHSLGVMPLALSHAALIVSASYKWTLGPYGVGIVYWNRDRLPDFRPGNVGWRSVEDIFRPGRFGDLDWSPGGRRFQLGAPALSDIAALGEGARVLADLGLGAVQQHAAAITARVYEGFRGLGLSITTPEDPDRRLGNVSFLHPRGEEVADQLADAGIYVWGGDGRVRASSHVMNRLDDVDRLMAGLADVFETLPAAP